MFAFTHLDREKHGTPEFPAEYYYVDSKHPRYQMPFHWHNDWELLRVLDGSLLLSLGEEQFSVQAGDVVLIRGGTLHGGVPCECVYEGLVFDLYGMFRTMDMVKKYLRPFYRQALIPQCFFPAGNAAAVFAVTDEIMTAFRDSRENSCPELETVAGLGKLFAWLLKNKRYRESSRDLFANLHRIDQIKTVLEYIETNYSSSLSLEALAKVVGMNPKYFCRVFASLLHQSPMDYVNFYRVEQAAYLLDSTTRSVTAVGTECGFSESSYFTKVFKKYKGITPSAYRRQAHI